MRLFIAIEPPEDAVADLEEFLDVRRGAGAEVRWSPPGQWHLTLAFMGAAPERVVEDLVERVGGVAARAEPLGLRITGGGCFPDVTRARVLWAGFEGGGADGSDAVGAPDVVDAPDRVGAMTELEALARGVRSACAVAGAAPEGGPFRPHLTLGRFAPPRDATRWVRLLETYAGPAWVASEVAVVESHLPRDRGHRPRHDVLARPPIGG